MTTAAIAIRFPFFDRRTFRGNGPVSSRGIDAKSIEEKSRSIFCLPVTQQQSPILWPCSLQCLHKVRHRPFSNPHPPSHRFSPPVKNLPWRVHPIPPSATEAKDKAPKSMGKSRHLTPSSSLRDVGHLPFRNSVLRLLVYAIPRSSCSGCFGRWWF